MRVSITIEKSGVFGTVYFALSAEKAKKGLIDRGGSGIIIHEEFYGGAVMISTKGRYSIRILLDLAEHSDGEFVPMKDVAERQGLSLKYVERIVPVLKEHRLVDSVHGKGGGYRLTRDPDRYTLWEILTLTEGDLAPVSCLKDGAEPCPRAAECKTLRVWEDYYKMTVDYFSGITLADLMSAPLPDNYVI